MDSEYRPDPDQILHSIRQSEEKANKGKLRVFLGMCAGAGKTYSMLMAARQIKAEGADVVIGYIETHGRVETESLTEGLEQIPRQHRRYRDIQLTEMDIDAILKRRPQIVLVDELAHTNVPESRHVKRYQDVEELINQGINVYTTLNVQHLESRFETVAEITGIRIHETVPDSFLQQAEIELVDITPDSLLKRMSEGKVYIPEKAKAAANHFFRKGNLHALRELALRFTAERVDIDVLEYMHAKNILSTWKTSEKLMVAIGPSPSSQKLIRWTRRMAFNLGAQWIAVSIDLGQETSHKIRDKIIKNQELARELGAKIIQITDNDVVSGLLKVAIQYNVTQIVVGKTNEHPIRNFLNGGSIVDRLMKDSDNIDIYVIKSDVEHAPNLFSKSKTQHFSWREFLYATLVILGIATLCYPIRSYIGYETVGLLFLLGISGLSVSIGRKPIVFAALLGSLIWDYFFIPPQFTFHIHNLQDAILLLANFFVAITGGTLIGRIRKNQVVLQKSQDNISVLFSIMESMNNAASIKEVVHMTRLELKKHFNADAIIYLQTKDEKHHQLDSKGFGNKTYYSEKEFSIANWAFENRQQAGKFTQTLPDSEIQYFPLILRESIIGVLGICFDPEIRISPDKIVLLRSFISQVTSSLQREISIDKTKTKQIHEESQKLFQAVLNNISHELRTPISVITTAVSNINDEKTSSNPYFRKQIGEDLNSAALRLNMLVENTLDISRIEAGHLSLNLHLYDVGELFGTVLNDLEKDPHSQKIEFSVPDDLPLIQMDISWLKQAIINLIHNAFLYTPAKSIVEMNASLDEKGQVVLEVADNGRGVPEEYLGKLFDKFYRVPGSKSGGTGLGLTIAKAIVEAHNGTITVENRPEGGLSFKMFFEAINHGEQ